MIHHDTTLPGAPSRVAIPLPVQAAAGIAVLAGAGAFAWALAGGHPREAWGGYLIGAFLALALGAFGVLWQAILYLGKATWSLGLRRVAEAMSAWLLPGGILALMVVFGLPVLYPWAGPEGAVDPVVQHKAAFLNRDFFAAFAGGSFALWALFAGLLMRNSSRQDRDGGAASGRRNVALSGLFVVLFALSFTGVSFLFLMSIEPHWSSTMFAVLTFTDLMQTGLAFFCLVGAWLVARDRLGPFANADHLHSAGKMMFAFTGFWAYIWFCQFLLIWYANLPEEVEYFLTRMDHGWLPFTLVLPVVKFVIPFVFLVPRESKRRPGRVAFWAIWIVAAQILELFLMVTPALGHGEQPVEAYVPWIEPLIALGFLGAFTLVFSWTYGLRAPVPVKDGRVMDCLHYHAA